MRIWENEKLKKTETFMGIAGEKYQEEEEEVCSKGEA